MKRYIKSSATRYFVTDDDYIPLHDQPNEGYTKLGAVERAQREAEANARLFKIPMSEAVKGYHIMDDEYNIIHELDSAI